MKFEMKQSIKIPLDLKRVVRCKIYVKNKNVGEKRLLCTRMTFSESFVMSVGMSKMH